METRAVYLGVEQSLLRREKRTGVLVGLGEYRERGNMTVEQLAERVGVKPQEIEMYEKGDLLPSLDVALRIAKALGHPVEDIWILPSTTHSHREGDEKSLDEMMERKLEQVRSSLRKKGMTEENIEKAIASIP